MNKEEIRKTFESHWHGTQIFLIGIYNSSIDMYKPYPAKGETLALHDLNLAYTYYKLGRKDVVK